jgi:23S rRNA (uracil1939-C5)-methyltransferase
VLSKNISNLLTIPDTADTKHHLFDNQTESLLGKHIHADETVFFQGNLEILPHLIDAIKRAAGSGPLFYDIFCGVGLFSAFLQSSFDDVIAVENNPLCQKFAEKNLNENCTFYAESAENFFSKNTLDLREACVLIDPPRPGLTNDLCNFFCKAKPQKLIYVSCNPATLARDTRKLLDAGYNLLSMEGFAFYPQTFHLEMLAVFANPGT